MSPWSVNIYLSRIDRYFNQAEDRMHSLFVNEERRTKLQNCSTSIHPICARATNVPQPAAVRVLWPSLLCAVLTIVFAPVGGWSQTASQIITTLAGTGSAGYSGDGSAATLASLNDPRGVAIDTSGNVYIADTANYVIRKVTPDGTITTIVGNGAARATGDGGLAASATLINIKAVAVD
jgi:hypothetical protein